MKIEVKNSGFGPWFRTEIVIHAESPKDIENLDYMMESVHENGRLYKWRHDAKPAVMGSYNELTYPSYVIATGRRGWKNWIFNMT